MLKQYSFFVPLLFIFMISFSISAQSSQSSTQEAAVSAESSVLLKIIKEHSSALSNYVCETEVRRKFAINDPRDGLNQEWKYDEMQYTLSSAYDRGKFMFAWECPAVVRGEGILEGVTDSVRQVYDGKTVMINHNNNNYVLSRKPERHIQIPFSVEIYKYLDMFIMKHIEQGSGTITEKFNGDICEFELNFPDGSMRISYNVSQHEFTEPITVHSPTGELGVRKVLSDYTGDGFLRVPHKVFQQRYITKDILLEEKEMHTVKMELNKDTVDESIFQMHIPPEATVLHSDLDILISGKEILALGDDMIELAFLEKKASQDQLEQAKQGAEPAAAKKDKTLPHTDNIKITKSNRYLKYLVPLCLSIISIICYLVYRKVRSCNS